MDIFNWITKNVFKYDPVIKTKPCEKKDTNSDCIVQSSKTRSAIFLKLIDNSFTCAPIKKVIFDNIVGYENNSEDNLWDGDYLKPKFISLYFYNDNYIKMVTFLKYKGYLSLIVPKDSVVSDIMITNQKSECLSFITTDYFKRNCINNYIDKITIGIELYNVYRLGDTIYSKTVPVYLPISSFINLNENDEITIDFTIAFTKSILNDIEDKVTEKISKRTNNIALKRSYTEWGK